jgi:D-alanine-D-alanine ligase
MGHYGISTPAWVSASHTDGFVPGDTYIVKAIYEDASVGLCDESIKSFRNINEIKALLKSKKEESETEFFAEEYIEGREFSISILGEGGRPSILEPLEILFTGFDEINKAKIIDYNAKWKTTSFEYQNTRSVLSFHHEDHALLGEMRAISEKCWVHFNLRGYARVDFRVDKRGKPWVIEINANPCITPGESGFLKAAGKSGFDFNDVIRRLIMETQKQNCPLPYRERCNVI